MNNIHLSRKFALWHNSTLVSEAEEQILKRSEGGVEMKPWRPSEA